MNKWKKKRLKWLIRKCQLGNKKRKRVKKIHVKVYNPSNIKREYKGNKRPKVILTPPNNFSLMSNPEKTMSFFMDFEQEINRNDYGKIFFIDSSKVEFVTADALIYLIAILQNDYVNNAMKYVFIGNYPEREDAKQVYVESGFTDYVISDMKLLPQSTDKMRIICGIQNDPEAARDLCDFVMKKLGKTRIDIQPIQKVLIELMSNVYHHAYEKNSFMAKKWYMYAEYADDKIRCIFVDTGFGIAKTAKKNFAEKIKLLFKIDINDADIIKSIFEGKFRTSTNQRYRGNGLSSVRKFVSTELFEEFEVISGKGNCKLPQYNNSKEIVSRNYKNILYGTLYKFVIK